MRIARFEVGGDIRNGIIEGETVNEISGDIFGGITPSSFSHRLTSVRLLAPVVPSQMFGPGLNFADHLHHAAGITGQTEMSPIPQPWHKGINSLSNPGDAIVIPFDSSTGIDLPPNN